MNGSQIMRTQLIQERVTGQPWLEHDPSDGAPPEQTRLDSFPFTIGRNETADLQIDSGRVSREHAAISKHRGGYRVEDLGSTNGTFVNGQRVQEAALHDGDILQIADVEMTFFSGRPQVARNAATQVMEFQDGQGNGEGTPVDVVRAVRRLREMLTYRGISNTFQPIADLEGGQILGYEALDQVGDGCAETEFERLLLSVECRLTARIRQLQRMLVAEQASRLTGEALIFVNLDASEIGARGLHESLVKLQEILSESHRLVIEVPDDAFCDTPYFREFRDCLQELGIGLAYDGFAAGQAQVVQLEEIRPDFLKLARPLVRGVHADPKRRRRLKPVIRAGREIGCEIIATGVRNEAEAGACRQLGCQYGQGDLFGPPQPFYALGTADRPRVDAHETG